MYKLVCSMFVNINILFIVWYIIVYSSIPFKKKKKNEVRFSIKE